MKSCPSCHQTYDDDSMMFCLHDGAGLRQPKIAADPSATWQGAASSDRSRRNTLPWMFAITLVIGASAVLTAWILAGSRSDDTQSKTEISAPTPQPTPTPSQTPSPFPETMIASRIG